MVSKEGEKHSCHAREAGCYALILGFGHDVSLRTGGLVRMQSLLFLDTPPAEHTDGLA